jgi:hypothetical protein
MSESLSGWLALREAADTAARSAALTHTIAEVVSRERPLRILDLGTGTGSNVRYLSPRLPVPQQWLVVDRDAALLAEALASTPDRSVETRCMELGGLGDPGLFAGRHLVTASALLDLVSADWLRRLAARCKESGATALFALTYNGESSCAPGEPEDETIRDLMNRHQRANDKGFGVAAGPDAVECAARCFAEAGYRVERARSDWVLAPEARDMQRELIDGWAKAALEIAPEKAPLVRDWLARRLAHVAEGRSFVTVGHEDLAAWL